MLCIFKVLRDQEQGSATKDVQYRRSNTNHEIGNQSISPGPITTMLTLVRSSYNGRFLPGMMDLYTDYRPALNQDLWGTGQ